MGGQKAIEVVSLHGFDLGVRQQKLLMNTSKVTARDLIGEIITT